MPTRDDILRDLTFKEEGSSVARRVADTLFGPEADGADNAARLTRIANAIGLLVSHLHETGALSDEQLDDLLFRVVLSLDDQ